MGAALTPEQAFLVLNALPSIGPVTLNRLLAAVDGDPAAIFTAPARQVESVKGVSAAASSAIRNWGDHFDLAREEERMARANVNFVPVTSADYPPLLREIHDPPIGLYRRGGYACTDRCIAIVGSRRTTLYGQATAKRLGAELAAAGFCVVSGLARGIDTAAHEGALSAGGRTIGVLGTGIDLVYPPENLDLYRTLEEKGAVLSEFPFGRRADRQSFAMRNRIVAGMSEAVVVVESDVSGGAMITARFAGEQGRHLFAVPGRIDQPTSAGCHQLIRDGATLLTGAADIFAELNYLDGLRPQAIPEREGSAAPAGNLNEDERSVWGCLSDGSVIGADDIIGRTGMGAARVSAALMMLEIKRLVAKRPDGCFEAVPV